MCVVLLYLTPSTHFVSSSYTFNTEASPNPRNDKNTHDIRHPVFFFLQLSSDSFSEDEYLLTGASLTFLIRTSSFSPLSIKLVSINGLTMMLVFPFSLLKSLIGFLPFVLKPQLTLFSTLLNLRLTHHLSHFLSIRILSHCFGFFYYPF